MSRYVNSVYVLFSPIDCISKCGPLTVFVCLPNPCSVFGTICVPDTGLNETCEGLYRLVSLNEFGFCNERVLVGIKCEGYVVCTCHIDYELIIPLIRNLISVPSMISHRFVGILESIQVNILFGEGVNTFLLTFDHGVVLITEVPIRPHEAFRTGDRVNGFRYFLILICSNQYGIGYQGRFLNVQCECYRIGAGRVNSERLVTSTISGDLPTLPRVVCNYLVLIFLNGEMYIFFYERVETIFTLNHVVGVILNAPRSAEDVCITYNGVNIFFGCFATFSAFAALSCSNVLSGSIPRIVRVVEVRRFSTEYEVLRLLKGLSSLSVVEDDVAIPGVKFIGINNIVVYHLFGGLHLCARPINNVLTVINPCVSVHIYPIRRVHEIHSGECGIFRSFTAFFDRSGGPALVMHIHLSVVVGNGSPRGEYFILSSPIGAFPQLELHNANAIVGVCVRSNINGITIVGASGQGHFILSPNILTFIKLHVQFNSVTTYPLLWSREVHRCLRCCKRNHCPCECNE